MKALGTPDVANGAKISSTISKGIADAATAFADAKDDAAKASTDPKKFRSTISQISDHVDRDLRAVLPGTLAPDLWEAKASWYDPAHNQANFLVTSKTPGFFNHWQPDQAALAKLGAPVRIYHTGPYTVYVYDKNLLAALPHQ